jgi:hypothetical protein
MKSRDACVQHAATMSTPCSLSIDGSY